MRKLVFTAFVIVAVIGLSDPADAVTTEIWTFDEPDGSATVTSSLGHVGILESDGTAPGVVVAGGMLRFDGHGRVVVPHETDLNPNSQSFSVSVDVRTTAVPDDDIGDFDLVRKGLSADGRYWKVELFPNAANTKAFAFCQMRGRNESIGKFVGTRLKWTGEDLSDGVWHTIECTKTWSRVMLAVDGTVRVTRDLALGSVKNTKKLAFGAKAELWQDMFIGDIGEIRYSIG